MRRVCVSSKPGFGIGSPGGMLQNEMPAPDSCVVPMSFPDSREPVWCSWQSCARPDPATAAARQYRHTTTVVSVTVNRSARDSPSSSSACRFCPEPSQGSRYGVLRANARLPRISKCRSVISLVEPGHPTPAIGRTVAEGLFASSNCPADGNQRGAPSGRPLSRWHPKYPNQLRSLHCPLIAS